ncbi:MAG TPA: lipoyl(octanoyl) transferase LipB [Planctomycetota bacterium]|nr:lipoyl(octanoyl) transferase LipB [Planctomycetota bacterium]HRR82579.1 lipoyl(octanoyl) transferase LipB [Planctomycetota bacterium]HRT95045.1 lipoyl(octanoyl) transferase LipB [Planctomycetota bacterium]
MPVCHVLRIPRIRYAEALEFQLRVLERVRESAAGDAALLLLEHEPVVTIGRSGTAAHLRVARDELARRGIAVHETNRGGDVTYHGPGQIVGYPIVYLPEERRDIHRFLRSLEAVVIRALARHGIEGRRDPQYTGVWVGDAKIAAIGVAFRRWTSHHGFALNVATDLSAFDLIVPCGIVGRAVTSMQRLLGAAPDRRGVEKALIEEFVVEFGLDAAPECATPQELLARLSPEPRPS